MSELENNRALFKKIRHIEIRAKQIVNSAFSGEYRSKFKGKGMQFSEVKEYVSGDDVKLIDWNVSARMGELFVKCFEEERESTSFIVFDASSSNDFGTIKSFKNEVAAEVAATLAFSAIKNRDKVGLIIFTDQIELYIPPNKSRNHVLRIIREILYYKPKSKKTDINIALNLLNHVHKKRGMIFLLSDFLFDNDYRLPLLFLSKKHKIICFHIYDSIEKHFPATGLIEFEDSETEKLFLMDTSSKKFQKTYQDNFNKYLQELAYFFNRLKVEFISLETSKDYMREIILFFNKF